MIDFEAVKSAGNDFFNIAKNAIKVYNYSGYLGKRNASNPLNREMIGDSLVWESIPVAFPGVIEGLVYSVLYSGLVHNANSYAYAIPVFMFGTPLARIVHSRYEYYKELNSIEKLKSERK